MAYVDEDGPSLDDRDAEKRKQADREFRRNEIDDREMSIWSLFMAAAMAGGTNDIAKAGKSADAAMSQMRQRFT